MNATAWANIASTAARWPSRIRQRLMKTIGSAIDDSHRPTLDRAGHQIYLTLFGCDQPHESVVLNASTPNVAPASELASSARAWPRRRPTRGSRHGRRRRPLAASRAERLSDPEVGDDFG